MTSHIRNLGGLVLALAFASSAHAVVLTHEYLLNGSLADSLGGPSLVNRGGTLTPSRYNFGVNAGLSLAGALGDTSKYSAEILMEFDSLAGTWKKILDIDNLGADYGLYIFNTNLQWWDPTTTGAGTVAANTDFHVVLTRDGTTTSAYLNGLFQFSFVSLNSIPSADFLIFFEDDFATGRIEAQPGSADYIRIYDDALTAEQVRILADGGSIGVPEPATLALLAFGLVGLGATRRRAH